MFTASKAFLAACEVVDAAPRACPVSGLDVVAAFPLASRLAGQAAALEFLVVHLLDGVLAVVVVGECHECEARGIAADPYGINCSELFKFFLEFLALDPVLLADQVALYV